MPIEFRCTQCAKLLRTGDDTAGKQAKCPACETILTVPSAQNQNQNQNQNPFGDGYAMPAPPMGSDNPYQAPPEYATQPRSYTAASGGEIRPTQIDFSETFSRTWASFTDQLGMCILVTFLCVIMSMVANNAAQYGGMFIGMAVFGSEVAGFVLMFWLCVLAWLFGIWIGIGEAMFFLKVARGQEAPISDIFAGGPYFLRAAGAIIMLILGWLIILAVCCLPGGVIAGIGTATNSEELAGVGFIIAGIGAIIGIAGFTVAILMLFQFYYLIIDRNMGIMEAFSVSRDIMAGNKGTAFVVLLVTIILGTIFAVCTCWIGLLAVIPYTGILYAVLYLSCSGQPTMFDLRNMQYQQQPQA